VAIVVFLYLFSRGELRRLKEITPLSGSLVFIATILGWMFLALSEEGHNLSEEGLNHIKNFFMLFTSPNEELYYPKEGYYYIKELFRLLTAYATEEPHAKPFYFYIPEILIGLGPWSLFMIVAIFLFFRKKSEYLRFPCLWFMAMFISLSLIASKHSRYLLPLYPAAALLAAAPWEGYLERPTLPWPKIKALPLLLLASILGLEIALLISHGLPAPAINIALVTIPLIAGIYFALKAAQFRLLFLSLLLTFVVFEFSYYQFRLPRENEKRSEKYLCQEMLRVMAPGSPWAVYNSFRPAYLFYTKMYPKCIPSEADLNQFLSSPERVYCLLRERDYAAIKLTVHKVLEFEGKKKKADDLVLVCNMPKG
jgi:4-amino-4-deoxy-L-arabinose transferase-like glycosyltransferase